MKHQLENMAFNSVRICTTFLCYIHLLYNSLLLKPHIYTVLVVCCVNVLNYYICYFRITETVVPRVRTQLRRSTYPGKLAVVLDEVVY